jgi:cysteinyl-tRNA synthetase
MSARLLGPSFDIHGGGQDLVFPHHENEMAQSAALGRPMANYWLHNGFVNINSEKMSKSLGNSFSVKDILKGFHPEVLRFFLLSSHYRGPVDFSDEAVREAGRALERVYRAVEAADACLAGPGSPASADAGAPDAEARPLAEKFLAAMDDDLNTSQALGFLFEAVHLMNRYAASGDKARVAALKAALVSMGDELGLKLSDHAGFFARVAALKEGDGSGASREAIEAKVNQRNEARAKKDWAEADRLRQELAGMGVVLEDRGGKTSWRYA